MREIKNVWADFPDNTCFACHPANEHGLKLKFYADDDNGEVCTTVNIDERFTGFPGIVHGGIQCAILDELAFWTAFDATKKICLTKSIEMDFKRAVKAPATLKAIGKITKIEKKKVNVNVRLLDEDGKLCTTATVVYLIPGSKTVYRIFGEERFNDEFRKYVED